MDEGASRPSIQHILTDPKRTDQMCGHLARGLWDKGIEVVIGLGQAGAVMASHLAKHIAILGRRADIVYSVFAYQDSNDRWVLGATARELVQGHRTLVVSAGGRPETGVISEDLVSLVREAGGILKGVTFHDGSLLSGSAGEHMVAM